MAGMTACLCVTWLSAVLCRLGAQHAFEAEDRVWLPVHVQAGEHVQRHQDQQVGVWAGLCCHLQLAHAGVLAGLVPCTLHIAP